MIEIDIVFWIQNEKAINFCSEWSWQEIAGGIWAGFERWKSRIVKKATLVHKCIAEAQVLAGDD